MSTKLTLTIEKEVIEIAKKYAKETGQKSLSDCRKLFQIGHFQQARAEQKIIISKCKEVERYHESS